MGVLQTLLATLVTLGILVTIHEWGHYWVARRCGVKVLRFSVGFGKPLFSWKGRDDTVYAVAMIPLGGYVSMLDEREGNVPSELKNQAFNNKPVMQRIAIVAAGPIVNLLFAVLAYWFLFVVGTQAIVPKVGDVRPGSPAAMAGINSGEEILSIDGHKVVSWDQVNLRLAARIGETGRVVVTAVEPGRSERVYQVELNNWRVDLERESPVTAMGFMPWRPDVAPVLGQLLDDGQAALSGLKTGDRIVAVNDELIESWQVLVEKVQASAGERLDVLVERNGERLHFEVVPAARQSEQGVVTGYIGAGVAATTWPDDMIREVRYNPIVAFKMGVEKTGQMIMLTLDSIRKMIVGVISVKNLSGPITIAKVAGDSAASGLETFISFLAYLSISLGILNLLPIPMLDGGHLMYYMVELIRGKPVSEQVQMFGLKIGMFLLFSLMALAIINDIARL
ncbi:RIP metalloprotease RseP [Nitrincola tibetensis]|uniref:Zinc metalloprotease n=1 Tax=Nitrincola tibetensis TaxID=2219697 RepID=A0A364NJB8_9GAMM|nr:RIP metalloprotease RseP [Nitrincola tibetensis]RAU17162.1 RIP metalloprotease RseP [Nitrincola tibetensis]